MRLTLLAIGRRMPAWVDGGIAEYQRRLPRAWGFRVREIAQANDATPIERMRREAAALLDAMDSRDHVVALDRGGRAWSTERLSSELGRWQDESRAVVLMIGGPDGLDPRCRERADVAWCLSPLTLPHPLVRVVVIEQLYRARSILDGHPYHRG